MARGAWQSNKPHDENFDVLGPSQEQIFGASQGATGSDAATRSIICYDAAAAARPDSGKRYRRATQYRVGGTKLISVPQATNLKEAVDYAHRIDLPLVAHFTIHWVGTDAGDDPDGKLFAKVRDGYARWLRRRGVLVWCREKLSGGQAEVEHAHLLVHLPAEWVVGAKLAETNGGVDGGADLLQAEAALHSVVALYAGQPDDYAVKLKLPTNGGLPGLYNGRSYDGLYLLKGGGPKVWKLFPRIRKEWRKPQGIIIGKRCGTTQNIGPAARRRASIRQEVA
jgi:hypothetical protein